MGFVYDEWYIKNKADLNKRRRDKYTADAEYRAKVQSANAASRAKAAEATAAEATAAEAAIKADVPGRDWKERLEEVVDPDTGAVRQVVVFSIGALAAATNRSIQVLRQWEGKGVIPPPLTLTAKGDRLYTAEQIEAIVKDLTARGKLVSTLRQRAGVPFVERTIRRTDGSEERCSLYKVSVLARAIKRTIVTVQHYEQRGLIPDTPFRASSRSYRLYTLEQLEAVRDVLPPYLDSLADAEKCAECCAKIRTLWGELGLDGAVLADEPEAGEQQQEQRPESGEPHEQ